jgi:ADP-glucose pyrophosphorylase
MNQITLAIQQLQHIVQEHIERLGTYDRDFVIDVLYILQTQGDCSQRQWDHVQRIINRIEVIERIHHNKMA